MELIVIDFSQKTTDNFLFFSLKQNVAFPQEYVKIKSIELTGDEKVHILLSLFTSSKGGIFQRRIKSTKN